jgi:hypothetical protein
MTHARSPRAACCLQQPGNCRDPVLPCWLRSAVGRDSCTQTRAGPAAGHHYHQLAQHVEQRLLLCESNQGVADLLHGHSRVTTGLAAHHHQAPAARLRAQGALLHSLHGSAQAVLRRRMHQVEELRRRARAEIAEGTPGACGEGSLPAVRHDFTAADSVQNAAVVLSATCRNTTLGLGSCKPAHGMPP